MDEWRSFGDYGDWRCHYHRLKKSETLHLRLTSSALKPYQSPRLSVTPSYVT